ncbi:MAG TPA: MFS transporter [Bryobacteraceae bacterium]|nr:MFS transporter [Bryobacteraceae bacterium]
MAGFAALLKNNPNYRYTWAGQVVSEVGDHFNTIAVFSLILSQTNSGLAVAGVMLARAIPMLLAGPLAGVSLDRFDRRQLMIGSDLVRAVFAGLFIFGVPAANNWIIYVLSALTMAASPFFTSGRASILPAIATKEELHTANSMTQTTQWTTTAVGAFLGGFSAETLGYEAAFCLNALSFLFSALCISRLRLSGDGFVARRQSLDETKVVKPWHDYRDGLRYMRSIPLLAGIGFVSVGWASGGGAAQILFPLFGDRVFHRGPMGTGEIWGSAGLGLVLGGVFAHRIMPRLSFAQYKRTVAMAYVVHGASYVCFALSKPYWLALLMIGLSRAAVAVSSVMNFTQLLRIVADEYRGRVFATLETLTWGVMMLSMTAAGLASDHVNTRWIGVASGLLSSCTAVFWYWGDSTGRLPQPPVLAHAIPAEAVEVHGDPNV